ncbi:hypothetical protein L0F51_00185 [Afifella sp. H1R]|nr:hypothetical protein [Afifella sp. H1R]MCF1502182.1 hypothetical protein [Afifella sp. H1R]
MRWLQVNDAFRQQYARARSEQADADADAIGDIAERVLRGEVEPNAGRVAIDALKWSAGKRKPKKYGDKLAIGGDRNMDPISTVDLTNLSDEQLAALKAVFGPLAGGANDDDAPDSAGRGSEAS